MQAETENIVNPFWKDNYTAIFVASDDGYVPYLCVYLQSIIEHADKNHNYDIVVFETSITNENKVILNDFMHEQKNISLRFFNPLEYFEDCNLITPHRHITKETYYRLCAPYVFKNYKKIIYTDIDLIFNEDPQKLYNLDMHGAPVCAALDLGWKRWVDNNQSSSGVNIRSYTKDVLKLNDITKYFNAGVLLLDIEKLNKENITAQFFEALNSGTFFLYQDQCIINFVLNGRISILPHAWNNMVIEQQDDLKDCTADGAGFIIHWITSNKPWINPERKFADIWYKMARKTPYYEVILKRMCNPLNYSDIISREDLKEVLNYRENIFKYKLYKVLSKITFGQLKETYKFKMQKWKNKVNKFRRIKRGW